MRSLLVLALMSAAVSAAAQPVSLSPGCYTLKAKSTGKYVSYNGPLVPVLNANRPEANAWEAFMLQRLNSPNWYRIVAHDGSVLRGTMLGIWKVRNAAGPAEQWFVEKEGDYYSLHVRLTEHAVYLSADPTLDGLLVPRPLRRDWELFSIEPTTGCYGSADD